MDWNGTFMLSRVGLHRGRPKRWLPRRPCYYHVWTRDWRFRVEWRPRRGLYIAGRTVSPEWQGTPVDRVYSWEWPNMKKRQAKSALGDANHLAPMESTRFSDLLSLVEHMACRKYDDGDPRETGWITLKTQGAAWVVQVKDPDACCSFSAVGETLDKALETAALLLSCDEAPWEPDTFLAASAARKRKK